MGSRLAKEKTKKKCPGRGMECMANWVAEKGIVLENPGVVWGKATRGWGKGWAIKKNE